MAFSSKNIQVHGHRGARGLYPENSLVAIQAAIDHGCSGIEVDLCVSRDDHLIVHHDPIFSPDLVRNADGQWVTEPIRIRELTLKEIQTYDIGRIKPETAYHTRFSSQQSIDGTRIPTLDEFITLVKQQDRPVIFNLELKSTPDDPESMPETDHYIDLVVQAILNHEIADRVFLQSFDWRLACQMKQRLPELHVGFLTDLQKDGHPSSPVPGHAGPWTNYQDLADFDGNIPAMIRSMEGNVWSSNYQDLTPEMIQTAHETELEVYVWTVNEEADMVRMIQWGVDAITTDYPDRLIALLTS